MIVFVMAMAVALLVGGPSPKQHGHHRHALPARMDATRLRQDTALQHRVARMARLALLLRREALLHQFLIAASTQRPLYRDDATHTLGVGAEISATEVALDFLDSAIIRARVRNTLATPLTFVLTAAVIDAAGTRGRASTIVTLQPRQARIVELLCPAKLSPAALIWSIEAL